MAEGNQNLSKGLVIAQLMQQQQQLTLNELIALSGFTKQSILRCLTTYIEHGWLRKRINDKRYVWCGMPNTTDTNRTERLANLCMPVLQRLSKETGYVSDLALLNSASQLYIVDSTRTRSGGAVHLYIAGYRPSLVMTALGRAYLLGCNEPAQYALLRNVAHSGNLVERNHLHSARWMEEIKRFQALGYSTREYEDYIPQLLTDSAPSLAIAVTLKIAGESIGAVNLVWDNPDISTTQFTDQYLISLTLAAQEIEEFMSQVTLS